MMLAYSIYNILIIFTAAQQMVNGLELRRISVVTINSLNDKDKSHFINNEYFCALLILLGSPKEYPASLSDTKPNEHFVLVILSIS